MVIIDTLQLLLRQITFPEIVLEIVDVSLKHQKRHASIILLYLIVKVLNTLGEIIFLKIKIVSEFRIEE